MIRIKNTDQNPLVSICIPTYNGEKYILEAIQSAVIQTYRPLEIVVSDDDSQDDTLKIIENFKTKTDIPITIYPHQPAGIGANWNHCIEKSNGDYIKFLFQDDVLMPDCVEKMVKYALNNQNIGLVYCKRDFIYNHSDENHKNWILKYGNLHVYWHNFQVENGQSISGQIFLKNKNLFQSPENKFGEPSAVLINKKVFANVGLFSTKLKQVLDIEFWNRLLKFWDVVYIEQPLIKFRLHEQQTTAINKKNKLNEWKDFYDMMYQTVFFNLSWHNKKYVLKRLNQFWYLIFSFEKKVFNKIRKFRFSNNN